jgi:hypothetical protein
MESMDYGWSMEGMHLLKNGQTLTIFAPDDSVLWSGILKTRFQGFLNSQTIQPHQNHWHPKDVPRDTWNKWFGQKPSLKAEIQF